MLPSRAESPPRGEGWFNELKLQGYRIQLRKAAGFLALLAARRVGFALEGAGICSKLAFNASIKLISSGSSASGDETNSFPSTFDWSFPRTSLAIVKHLEEC